MIATERLILNRPHSEDVNGLYSICSDPRVWTHFPSLRHIHIDQTRAMLERWAAVWDRDGLGTWIAREPGEERIAGYGGCSVIRDTFWNLGYRFDPDLQGRGFATEISLEAIRQATRLRPALPIVAYLLEHNASSARVAEKVGLTLMHRGPDAGNPDPNAVRLVYADRQLSSEDIAATMQ